MDIRCRVVREIIGYSAIMRSTKIFYRVDFFLGKIKGKINFAFL